MEYLRGSPARLLKFKEKLAYEFDYCSTPKSKKDRQSRLEGLNLSARKSLSLPVGAKLPPTDSSRIAARQLFEYSTLNNSFKGSVRDKLQENVQSFKKILDSLPKRKDSTTKRKFSSIMNDNRLNYEPVDLSVDLCCDVSEDANDSTEQLHKKLRMSV